jgi:hypothetical protein
VLIRPANDGLYLFNRARINNGTADHVFLEGNVERIVGVS